MTIYGDGKTTYTDADSLSDDLGDKVRRGDKEALQKLKNFAENFDPEQPHSQARALYELGEVYFNGMCDVKKSTAKALEYFTKAAELNDALALIQLGEYYRDGKQGFIQDGQRALECFLKAAEHGKQKGYELAAELFSEGRGVKADGYRAIEFYERLDELDDKDAAMNIARIYTKGCGSLKANGYKALEIYEDIIRQGKYWAKVQHEFGIDSSTLDNYKEALDCVAQIYLEGKAGVEPDGHRAIEYLIPLAENGDMDAVKELARIYWEGKAGVEPDGYRAIEYLIPLAENGDTDALGELAEIYWAGKAGVEPDGYRAISYFEEIVQRNEKYSFPRPFQALRRIAMIWRRGEGGVAQSGTKAVEYLTKLAEYGDRHAQNAFFEIGEIYEEGCSEIAPDLTKAIEFYQKADELEHCMAKYKLKKLTGSEDE